jgi:hypothetical protein
MVAGCSRWTYLGSMEQPKFPTVLVVLVAFFVFLALWSDVLWITASAWIGAFFVASAAVYQSLPRRAPQEPIDEDTPPFETPT